MTVTIDHNFDGIKFNKFLKIVKLVKFMNLKKRLKYSTPIPQ